MSRWVPGNVRGPPGRNQQAKYSAKILDNNLSWYSILSILKQRSLAGLCRTLPHLEAVITETSLPVNATVIWLHGLGADGHDFAGIIPQLQLPQQLGIRFIFPHAPERPVTLNNGFTMRAWYDIYSLNNLHREDRAGIEVSERAIGQLIMQQQSAGIPANRIILAGFSQGGAMALHTGLRYPLRLGGIIGLSTYLPLLPDFGATSPSLKISKHRYFWGTAQRMIFYRFL